MAKTGWNEGCGGCERLKGYGVAQEKVRQSGLGRSAFLCTEGGTLVRGVIGREFQPRVGDVFR